MLLFSVCFAALTISSTVVQTKGWCQDYESRRCTFWKAKGLCKSRSYTVHNTMRRLCYETCNFCDPPSPEVCYDRRHQVSAHGCCWDGIIAATGPGGQGCPVCEDRRSRNFCSMMKDMCFTRENHKLLRANCPETCGYCKKAPHPCRDDLGQEVVCQNECYDLDPKELCERRQWTGYCKVDRWQDYLKKRCARTCGFCGANQCRDMMLTRVCSLWKARNRCTNSHPAWRLFMKQNCRLTCGLCREDRFECLEKEGNTLA